MNIKIYNAYGSTSEIFPVVLPKCWTLELDHDPGVLNVAKLYIA